MAPFAASIRIARPAEEVFAYIADLSRHGEWQSQIQEIKVETEGPTRVGSRSREKRKASGFPAIWATYEITAFDPPRSVTFHGIDGPVRVVGTATVSPADGGSTVSLEIDIVPHGIGRLFASMVRKQMRKEVPADQQRLKERLEAQTA